MFKIIGVCKNADMSARLLHFSHITFNPHSTITEKASRGYHA